MNLRFFGGTPPPEITEESLPGRLLVVEGPDGSGRSTQIGLLSQWLEASGHAVQFIGLSRSSLASEELEEAKQTNLLTRTTRSLFYATDFYEQLVNKLIPALRAGLIVIADRYVYTLMARDRVRGADRDWVQNLYRHAIIPDAVFYLHVGARQLVERNFLKHPTLDYWESGMDLGLSRDMFAAFLKYQRLMQMEFEQMSAEHGFEIVNGNQKIDRIQRVLRQKIGQILGLI